MIWHELWLKKEILKRILPFIIYKTMIIYGIYCISHTKDQITFTYKLKKICIVWNNWLFLNYISYNWNLTYEKSISLPQVLKI